MQYPDGRLINDIYLGWYMNVNGINIRVQSVSLIPFKIYKPKSLNLITSDTVQMH